MAYIQKKLKMMRVISSFADGPVNFHSTGPTEDQIQKLISSTVGVFKCSQLRSLLLIFRYYFNF